MTYPTILPHLKTQLKLNIRAKDKSLESFTRGSISKDVHTMHVANLDALIKEHKSAIEKLIN